MAGCDVQLVLQTLRNYFQPDTFDRIFTQMDRFMSYVRTDQQIEKFLMEFGILRQKAEKLMCPAGGGFEDLFICFQCIKAARLRPNDRILLVASLGGSVDFARVTQHLRQLFTQPAATKEDIFPVMEEMSGTPPDDLSYEAWVAYHQKRKSPTGGGNPSRSRSNKGKGKKNKPPKGGKERNGFNRRTGERNRCYGCGSEYHLLPKCPTKQEKKGPVALPPPPSTPRSSFSSITLEDTPQDANVLEHSFTTSLSKDRPIFYAHNDSVVILDTGATANLVCFNWLAHHNDLLARRGLPKVVSYPAHAMFKFGDGRLGEVCHAADITVGVAGVKGTFTAFVLDSDIPALLSKGALESLQGCLDFAQRTLTLGRSGKVIPLQMSDMGHYILSVADFPNRLHSASLLHWTPLDQSTRLMDLMRNGGFRWAEESEQPSIHSAALFQTPQLFSACKAVTLRDAGNADVSDPSKVIMKLHVNWGHASATQIKRVLVDAEGDTQSLL